MSYFKAVILGNIGKDAESRTVSNGDTVVSFSVAHSQGSGDKQTTTWAKCNKWFKANDKQGIVQYLKKGTMVLVEGVPSVSAYQTRDGGPGASLELLVTNITLAGKSGNESQSSYSAPQAQAQTSAPSAPPPPVYAPPAFNSEDDIPF